MTKGYERMQKRTGRELWNQDLEKMFKGHQHQKRTNESFQD